MAKKTDKAIEGLAKEVKKLRKENEKLGKTLEKSRKDQAKAQARTQREILALIEERLSARETVTDEPAEVRESNGSVETAETTDGEPNGEQHAEEEGPEVTAAAQRRADELGVDPTSVEGTGSGGRVLVKDVEEAAG